MTEINEDHLFEWLRYEKRESALFSIPNDVDQLLLDFFKKIREEGDERKVKNYERMYNEIYRLRLAKMCRYLLGATEGYGVILEGPLCEREEKLRKEVYNLLVEDRKSIFPFLRLSHQMSNRHVKVEFSEEEMEDEKQNKGIEPEDLISLGEDDE